MINLMLSAWNMTNVVLLNSPKWYLYFPFKQFGRNFLFILNNLQCVINSILSQQNNLFYIEIVKRK